MPINEKYSHKDFTHKILTDTDPEEWNDTEVVGACFGGHDEPDTEVFPRDIRGVTFTDCNLNNVKLPADCTTKGGCAVRWKVQNDLEDWIVDASNNPVEPIDKARFIKLGLSIDPSTIPIIKRVVSITAQKTQELEDGLESSIKSLVDAAVWR